MKTFKNIAIIAFAASFMFAGVGFHYANNYTNMDTGTNVATSWGVSYDLNDNTSVGWDSELGMLMSFDAPMGVTLRLGWTGKVDGSDEVADGGDGNGALDDDNGFAAETSVGLGFTWWTGGTGVKTSISTNYDYVMAPNAGAGAGDEFTDTQLANSSNLSVVVGFGF